jgi:hypothetical protein
LLARPGILGGLPSRPVVVCGAGAAGLAAALAAARSDADVLLLEASQSVGGTVANALIHTIGGLYDSSGQLLNDGLPRNLIERLQAADCRTAPRKMGRVWVLQVCPNAYRATVESWIHGESRLTTLLGATITRVGLVDSQIAELTVMLGNESFMVRPRAVIDTTGAAEVAQLIGPSHFIAEQQRAGAGLIFRLCNLVPGALEFPRGIGLVRAIRAAADLGTLPQTCRHAWLDLGMNPNEAFVKLLVPLSGDAITGTGQNADYQNALAAQAAIVAFLRRLPGFRDAAVAQTGVLGIRDGGRIVGRYTLTGDDVRTGRTFDDGACLCAWPIEYWDPLQGVSIEHLPSGAAYEIPMRCLELIGIENYWAAGKCLSADRFAHASARVAGTCWAMGQAVGAAAAAWKEKAGEQESVRAISRYRTTATGSARNNCDEARNGSVLPVAR